MSLNLNDRQSIVDALTKYAWGFDENDFSLLSSVFAEDAKSGGQVADTEISWGPMNGRQEIVGGLQGMRNSQVGRRRHCLNNYLFTAQTDTSATVRCYMTLLSAADGKVKPVTMGIFEADLTKQGNETWLIKRLDITLDAPF